jgi:glycerophosphoryl diester phosphodiesterase
MTEAATTVLHCFRRTWVLRRRFLGAHIALTLLAAAIISPTVAVFLRAAIGLSGEPALADQDIARFLVSPVGLVCLVAVVSVLITTGVLETSVMMSIDMADRRGTKLGFWAGLAFVLRRLSAILAFAGLLVVRIILIAAPFLLAAALTARHFLGGYDINYYLTARPPEFTYAVLLIGTLIAILAVILLNRLIAWSLALPGLLFSSYRPAGAFRESAKLTRGYRKRLLALLVIWALASTALGLIVLGTFGSAADRLLPLAGTDLGILSVLMLGVLVLWYLATVVLTALTTGSFSILLSEQLEARGAPVAATFDAKESRMARSGSAARTLTAALGIAALISAAGGLALLADVRTVDTVEIIGHRGAAGARPENTIASVRRAIEDEADWIEIDVQETADGEVVVIHDSDFMKLAGVDLKVWDATMSELAGIDIGTWFSPDYAGERTPTLRAVLEEAKGKARVLIELKFYGHNERLEERVAGIVEAAGMTDSIAVMSLKYPMVQKMKALRPHWRVGLLATTAIGDLTRLEADFLAVNAGMATSGFIQRARKAGQDVFVWTVNDPLSMSRMISRGAAGLITDEPALARDVLSQRATLSTPERLLLHTADLFGLQMNTKIYRDVSP